MANWFSGGRLTSPVAGTIIADTGPLGAGTQELQIMISATAVAQCELQLRNAANLATIKSQVISVPANDCVSIPFKTGISNGAGERFRIELLNNVVGFMSASIIT